MTSEPFRIPRTLLARLAAEQYVRSFWWFVMIVPLFGVVAMIFGTGLIQVVGMFAVLWPVTIPTRAILGGWKTGTFFSHPVTLEADGETLYFHGESGDGMKLALNSVRKREVRHGFLLLVFGIGQFVAIPLSALGADLLQFIKDQPTVLEPR